MGPADRRGYGVHRPAQLMVPFKNVVLEPSLVIIKTPLHEGIELIHDLVYFVFARRGSKCLRAHEDLMYRSGSTLCLLQHPSVIERWNVPICTLQAPMKI